MKRFPLYLIISCLFTQTAHAQFGRYPAGRTVQNGKIVDIENVIEIPLTAKENFLQGQVETVTFRDYVFSDATGKTLIDTGTNFYDRTGHLGRQKIHRTDGTRTLICTYVRDNQRLLYYNVEETGMNARKTKTEIHYDDKNHLTGQATTDASDNRKPPISRMVYSYDDKGNRVEEMEFGPDNKMTWITTYTYDGKNRQTTYMYAYPSIQSTINETMQYDQNGFKAGGTTTNSNRNGTLKWTAKNDSNGRRTETTEYDANGKVSGRVTYKYDSRDNVTEHSAWNADGTRNDKTWNFTYEYEYDKQGNITKYTEYRLEMGKMVPNRYAEMKYTYWE